MTDEQIKHMAQRFLGWRIPEPFRPDAGISFDPVFNKGTQYEGRHQPTGTNLWGYDEAVAMVWHMIEGLPCEHDWRLFANELVAIQVCGRCGLQKDAS